MASVKDEKDGHDSDRLDHWYLVDTHGQRFRLPKTMLFLGREECDVVVASQSVDKRHAVLTFDLYLNRFKVKDLSTTNGTFVNNSRIPEEEYVTLSHMDTVRLGQDAMMYHMEQGSQITTVGEHLPDPQYIPSWASRAQDSETVHVHGHTLAECQGCIAEQKIDHTCGLMHERRSNGNGNNHATDARHLLHHHLNEQKHLGHFSEDHHHPVQPGADLSQQLNGEYTNHNRSLLDQFSMPHVKSSDGINPQHSDVDHQQTSNIIDNSLHLHPDVPEVPTVGRNTWPKKRQVRKTAHVESVFIPEVAVTSDASDNHDNVINQNLPVNKSHPVLVSNDAVPKVSDTLQMNVTSEAHPAGTVHAMYFVTFDDALCNTDAVTAGDNRRRPRITRNNAPNELATVKKGTPLYGQPSWWGEAEDVTACNTTRPDGTNRNNNKSSRPTNLGLKESGISVSDKSEPLPKIGTREAGHVKMASNSTYMEIPINDDDSPVRADNIKEVSTPAKSLSSSLSKDSLSVSPELKQQQPNKTAKTQSPSADVNTSSMSFTVDLDDPDHPPKKQLNIGSSISEFVPSKIRKNFRERKTLSTRTSSKESTPSKNSEERDLSPLSQRKLDEVCNASVTEGRGKSWLSSVQANVGSSLRSPNLEEIDRLSEFSDERKSLDSEPDRKGSLKRPVASKSPQISSKAAPLSGLAPSSKSPAGVSVNQYTDPTSYLIDKMFEGGSNLSSVDKQDSPEQKLYKEAAGYDKGIDNRRSTDKALARPIIDLTPSPPTAVKNARKVASTKTSKDHVGDENDVISEDNDLRITEDIQGSDNRIDEKDDKEDKASEAGTYTIEADVLEGQEEKEARKRIDQVFGVDVEHFNADWPVIDPLRLASPGGYDNLIDLDNEDGERTPLDESCMTPASGDTDVTVDEDYYEESSDMAAADGVEMWVSQLTALTNHKSADANRTPTDDGEASLSKKPPQGISRKRPGTGRKLPSIPSNKSPSSSEHSFSHSDFINNTDLAGKVANHTGSGRSSAESSNTPRPNSSQSCSKSTTNGPPASPSALSHSKSIGSGIPASPGISSRTKTISNGLPSNPGASSRPKTTSNGPPASPGASNRSRGSLDTEILLQDTETAMAAIQARITHKSGQYRKNSFNQDSDTDASSTVAMVNGDEDYAKSRQYKSPRDALAQRQKSELSSAKPSISTSSVPVKKPIIPTYSQTSKSLPSPRSTPSSNSAARKSIVSDVISRRDSMDNDSIISDISSEAGEGHHSRSQSKGKGSITMTRMNKTFDLRRARVDSFEEPTTYRSVRSSAASRSSTSGTYGRSQSLHSTTRNSSLATTSRSGVTSLGAQIVKKSQSNLNEDKARKTGKLAVSRTDSGGAGDKHSQRLQHTTPLVASHPSGTNINSKKDLTPKIQQRLTPTNKAGLVITGISNSSSQSQSQPGSRSNSPKSAEKMAWKRRKEYDPRKSVAEAKAGKTKDGNVSGVTMRHKPSASSSIRRRMIRSASFTNSAGLSLGLHNCGSSSQDLSDRRDSINQHEELRRAFIPFHSLLRNDRSTLSADEEDHVIFGNSTQTSYDSLIVASIYQLSLKLKTTTDKTLNKLRDQNRVSHTPSPIDDFVSDSSKSEIPAWKTANQELAGTLKNLRKLERHVNMMNTVIFPEADANSEVSSNVPASRQVKQKLLEDIERKFGFQPIDHPHTYETEAASPEMAEFSGQF